MVLLDQRETFSTSESTAKTSATGRRIVTPSRTVATAAPDCRRRYHRPMTQRAPARTDGPSSDRMRAVVFDRYGPPDVLRLADVERPLPKEDEVLVKVHASTVTRTDAGLRSAEYFVSRIFTRLLRPKQKILGVEMAGAVEAVGPGVTEFSVGDRVFGAPGLGAHAEFVCMRESAPLCDGAILALACLRAGGLQEGQSILIYGASGAVGTAAVQLAKHWGARLTAVCDTKNVDLARSLGADEVIDYTQEDFTQSDRTYDVVFDAVGKTSFRRCRRLIKPGGSYVETDLGFMWHVPALVLLTRWVGNKRVKLGITRYAKEDVLHLKDLAEAGRYRAVIDRTYPLEDVVEATRYVETGQKTGNVVLTITANRSA